MVKECVKSVAVWKSIPCEGNYHQSKIKVALFCTIVVTLMKGWHFFALVQKIWKILTLEAQINSAKNCYFYPSMKYSI